MITSQAWWIRFVHPAGTHLSVLKCFHLTPVDSLAWLTSEAPCPLLCVCIDCVSLRFSGVTHTQAPPVEDAVCLLPQCWFTNKTKKSACTHELLTRQRKKKKRKKQGKKRKRNNAKQQKTTKTLPQAKVKPKGNVRKDNYTGTVPKLYGQKYRG